ncbi:MAG: hypothetical protein AMS15_01915 [Planctomycetes bacterium DG_23]|nr:MAG: hypothetical protein AMS15_01915 [Planctomycetes bacterium DG_23]
MRIVYFDCFSGVSGDMVLGALLDAGLSFTFLKKELCRLPVKGYSISKRKVTRSGFAGTKFTVRLEKKESPRRGLKDILEIIQASRLSDSIKANARRIFQNLARAEARAHNTPLKEVHFHEVGAVDALIDVLGACIGLEALEIDQIISSPVAVGRGFVNCAHGRLPVPAPATALLLQGTPTIQSEEEAELSTPTGVAIITTLASSFGTLPQMCIEKIGYGAGERENKLMPNLLRVFIGQKESPAETDQMLVMETNIDDMSPEIFGYLYERLFDAGAVEVFTTPIGMKKGRPGIMLSVILPLESKTKMERILFEETTTFGVRYYPVRRSKLTRSRISIKTEIGEVRVKIGKRSGRIVSASPEYEDCRKLAGKNKLPLKEVYAIVQGKLKEKGWV